MDYTLLKPINHARLAFEKAVSDRDCEFDLRKIDEDTYHDSDTQVAWELWQAALSRAAWEAVKIINMQVDVQRSDLISAHGAAHAISTHFGLR